MGADSKFIKLLFLYYNVFFKIFIVLRRQAYYISLVLFHSILCNILQVKWFEIIKFDPVNDFHLACDLSWYHSA